MSHIFISYRRGDRGYAAGRLYDWISDHFGAGHIFYDIESIPPGTRFSDEIAEAVRLCDVFLAVIGDRWLDIADGEGNRRLDNPQDLVRQEIATALKRDIPVIPVLVAGATIPAPDNLPADLAGLSERDAVELDLARWRTDIGDLIESLERTLAAAESRRQSLDPEAETGPLDVQAFDDERIDRVVRRLQTLHQKLNAEFLPVEDLFPVLRLLFRRRTFRESLRDGLNQDWTARLRSACQTLRVLQAYEENVEREGSDDQRQVYGELTATVDTYRTIMAALLFDPPVSAEDPADCVEQTTGPAADRHSPLQFQGSKGRWEIEPDIEIQCEEPRKRILDSVEELR